MKLAEDRGRWQALVYAVHRGRLHVTAGHLCLTCRICVLCCVVLCYIVLCCGVVILCCVLFCCVVLCGVLCCVVL